MSHLDDLKVALDKIPVGQEFRASDVVKAGYPHKDAAKLLQSQRVLGVLVGYSTPSYRDGAIRYKRTR